jgi:PTH1 family peptidyl-tRNA hydrolase
VRAVVGLGNPGPEYLITRHNLGFWVLERLLRTGPWVGKRYPWGEVYRGEIGFLLRPLTYMNCSGEAVGGFCERFSLVPAELLVVYDDLDLPLGAIRLRPRGGPGGHQGMCSVLAALGTEDVPRLRVGIGSPPPGVDLVEFVLSPPSLEEARALEGAVDLAARLSHTFLSAGISAALDSYSRPGHP